MRYHWTECPACHCQIAVNTTASASGISGSLRRWSTDRSVNDGRAIRNVLASPSGGFVTPCVCGETLTLGATSDAVGTERGEGLR